MHTILLKNNIILKLKLLFFSIAVFCYYAQFLIDELSSLIIPSLGVYLVLSFNGIAKNINRNNLLLLSIYYIFIGCLLVVSAFYLIEPTRIIRFFLILSVLPLFFLNVHEDTKNYYFNIFIFFSCLKSLSLIIIYGIFLYYGSAKILREIALNNNMGDIYSTGGLGGKHLYIQVRGNALLLVAFMLRFYRTRRFDILNFLLFIGVFLAGNFAFYLGLILFFSYYIYLKMVANKEWYLVVIFVFFLFIAFIVVFFPYVQKQIQAKSEISNAVRIEQAKVLLSGNILTGNGIGNYIKATILHSINYDGALYFELQTLYIINQIGIIGYLLFMFCTIYIFYKMNREMMNIYLIYLFYSFWNPYCFDTTHMIAVMLLLNEKYNPIGGELCQKKSARLLPHIIPKYLY